MHTKDQGALRKTLPAIDVVILTIDRRDDVHACIDSVQEQDHEAVNLFLLDQGSRPEIAAELDQRARAEGFTFLQTERIGIARGRNLGATLGSAPVIVSLDNDAVLSDTGALRRVAELMSENDQLGVLGFAIHDYHRGGPDLTCWAYPFPVESHFEKPFLAARFMGGGHAIRRTAFDDAGGYDPELFFFGEELDLAFSLVAAGYQIEYRPEVAMRHKASLEGRIEWDSGRFYHNVRNMLYLNRKHFGGRLLNLRYAAGYLLKGALNGYPAQAWKGVRDGYTLAATVNSPPKLAEEALDYVLQHEIKPRGSAWQRLKQEVTIRVQPTGGKD